MYIFFFYTPGEFDKALRAARRRRPCRSPFRPVSSAPKPSNYVQVRPRPFRRNTGADNVSSPPPRFKTVRECRSNLVLSVHFEPAKNPLGSPVKSLQYGCL